MHLDEVEDDDECCNNRDDDGRGPADNEQSANHTEEVHQDVWKEKTQTLDLGMNGQVVYHCAGKVTSEYCHKYHNGILIKEKTCNKYYDR